MTDKEKLIELIGQVQYLGGLELALADHLIANGVTFAKDINAPSKWISVKDRLPEEADRYLCNIKSFAFPGLFYQAILKYDKHGFQEGHIYTDYVTHWMPMPEPPKGE